jgi:predicted nucleotidyltransferase
MRPAPPQDFLDATDLSAELAVHDVGLLVAFGSRVRRDHRPSSDLDLGVRRSDGHRYDRRALGALATALQLRSVVEVDVVDLADSDVLFRFEVLRDGVVLYDRGGQRAEFESTTLIEHDDVAWGLEDRIDAVRRRAGG